MVSDITNIVKRNQVLLLIPAALLMITILKKYGVDEIVFLGSQNTTLNSIPILQKSIIRIP